MALFDAVDYFIEYDISNNVYLYDPKKFDIKTFLTFFKDNTVVVHGHTMRAGCFLLETCHRIIVDHTQEEVYTIHVYERTKDGRR